MGIHTDDILMLAPGVTSHPDVAGGRPVVEGTQLAVADLLKYLGGTMTVESVATEFGIEEERLRLALRFVADVFTATLARVDEPRPPSRLAAASAGALWKQGGATPAEEKARAKLKLVWPSLAQALDRLAHYV